MKLYTGGTILTMEARAPRAQALLEDGGVIRALGGERELRALAPDAVRVDLEGGALLPAFIDAHSHFSAAASALLQVPLGECVSRAEIKERVEAFIRKNAVPEGQWVVAKEYDPDALEDAVPDAAFLDTAAGAHPLLLQHRSGHTGVCNTAALRALGVTADTPDPPDGRYGRRPDGAPDGYLEEGAFMRCVRLVPPADGAALLGAYRRAQEKYASFGIATAQEGMMVSQMMPLYDALLGSGLLALDLVGYAELASADALYAHFPQAAGRYDRHFRLGGVKTFLDGSPQARTAWMRPQSAYLPRPGETAAQTGYGTLSDGELLRTLEYAARRRLQLLAHCNGDAAAQQFLEAVAKTERQYPDFASLRPVMIHAQFLAPDQLPLVRETGVTPSFFVAHVWHWGDIHARNLGEARAALLSPAADALRAGIRFTFHQDAPVIEPDMLETVWCAVCRRTKSGRVLGEQEAIPVQEALRAVTINAAWQYGEENEKGSLRAGKKADLVLLDRDPTAVPKETLRDIRVLRTVKGGRTIFEA
ncbi:MAG: amidohydrolase [Oscillospiraceae bacterium]|nr:amidohydrolase [Oscillospiraceae bacterium]